MPSSSNFSDARHSQEFQCLYRPQSEVPSSTPVCIVSKGLSTKRFAERRLQYRERLPRKCARCLSAWIKTQGAVR
jgi:hypothetical protein